MAQRMIDLDELVPETVDVKMGGEIYLLPGDIPMPDFLRMANLWDHVQEIPEDEKESPYILQLYEVILELFRSEDSSIESLPLGPRRLGVLVMAIFAGGTGEEPEAKPGKARPKGKSAGTRSTKSTPKRPTKSRSSKR